MMTVSPQFRRIGNDFRFAGITDLTLRHVRKPEAGQYYLTVTEVEPDLRHLEI